MIAPPASPNRSRRPSSSGVGGLDPTGVSHALIAYGIWGFAPIYWRETAHVPAPEILAYRILSSFAVAVLLVIVAGVWGDVARVLRSPRATAAVVLSCVLLATNWLTFIYAVQTDRILATSLGYYINPLVNVVLGLALLGERLTRTQGVAVAIAAAGVCYQTWQQGSLPWISLVVATSFGLYGLVRKLAPAPPLAGFGLETLTMAPLAAGFLWLLSEGGDAVVPSTSSAMKWVVAGSGLLTAGPLLAFASAANRLPLSTLGMFQFIAPTLAFLIAVAFYGEALTRGHAVSFGCVWIALALFGWESRQRRPQAVDPSDVASGAGALYSRGPDVTPEVDR